ncbi:MAG TPA: hypothetical protein VGR06_38630, partial [Actinophytocola sp.]|nr:hypothetical protein [Actinophytocola sp.]
MQRRWADDRVCVHETDQLEVARLAGEESKAAGAELRQRYFIKVRDVVQAGTDAGEFRTVDAGLDTLLMCGSAQWAWTWFRPTGSQPADRVAGSFVDLVL